MLPCDLMARVAPSAEAGADFELGLARRLIDAGSPVAAPDPRVEPRGYQRDGFVITLWTYYPSAPAETIPPAAYADALHRRALLQASPSPGDEQIAALPNICRCGAYLRIRKAIARAAQRPSAAPH